MSEIIPIGGAAFSAEPRNLATANIWRNVTPPMQALDARPSRLPFFQRTPDLRGLVLAQDVVFVGGGNTTETADCPTETADCPTETADRRLTTADSRSANSATPRVV